MNHQQKINLGHVKIDGEMAWVTVEVELREMDKGQVQLSIMGDISRHSSGQVQDTIRENLDSFTDNRTRVERILELWDKYHLNDMHAGTPTQENILEVRRNEYLAQKVGGLDHYMWARMVLAEHGLLKDGTYEYGSGWKYEEIPAKVIEEIKRGL